MRRIASITGQTMNEATRNKSGDFRKNASMKVEINMNELVRQVYNLVKKNELKSGETMSGKTMKFPSLTETPEEIVKKRKKNWIISHLGIAGTVNSAVLSGISLKEHHNSGDMATFDKKVVSSLINTSILLAGTMGGPAGMVTAVALSTIYGYVGTYISNSIQNKYDTERLNYRLSNHDLRKHSTFIYDTTSSRWTAEEMKKSNLGLLTNRQSA